MLQGILFFIAGVLKSNLRFRFRRDLLGITGSVFLIYAFVIYPALGYWFGHRYPAAATFGLPCPTTIFTFGMLLWTGRRAPLYLLPIPVAWSFMGFWAAISMGMTEDFGLLVAGIIASLIFILRDRRRYDSSPSEGMSAVLSASGICFAFDDSRMLHGLTECNRRLPANLRLALPNTKRV